MNRFSFSSLRNRLLLLVLATLLPILGVLLLSASVQRSQRIDAAQAELMRLTYLAARNEQQTIEDAHQLLITLARLPVVQRMDPTACAALFADLLPQYPQYSNIAVVQPSGEVSCSALPQTAPLNLSDQEYFQRTLKTADFVAGPYLLGRQTGKPTIPLSYPIFDATGSIQSVIVLGLDVTQLNRQVAEIDLPKEAVLTILSPDGIVIGRYPDPQSWVGQPMNPSPLYQTLIWHDGQGTAEVLGVDGIMRLYAFTTVHTGTGSVLYVMIGLPQEAIVAESDQRFIRSLIGVVLLGIIALGMTWVLADRLIMRPVQALVGTTRRLAAGNLQTRSPGISRSGEFGQLAQAFDEMAAQLEAKTAAMTYEIAERTRAEEQVRQLNVTLEQRVRERTVQIEAVNKELEAFSYSVSHDLRAPLRGIDGFSKILLEHYEPVLDAQGKLYLQRVRAATQRMAQLIDDLLDLSRITRSQMRVETVDLSALAQTIAAELHQSDPERNVTFTIAGGLSAQGDGPLLRIVLENLLDNAWKFTGKRPSASIEFGVLDRDGMPTYFVRDTGAGFEMEYAGKLFGAFQRLHGMTEFPGTGIGLATVQRILHRHGGTIWAEGAVDQGATFYFAIPTRLNERLCGQSELEKEAVHGT